MEAKRKFFHQQLFGLYFLFFLSFILMISAAISLNILREHQLTRVISNNVPYLESSLLKQQLLHRADKALTDLKQSTRGDSLVNNHRILEKSLAQLKSSNVNSNINRNNLFIYLTENDIANSVVGISENDQLNRENTKQLIETISFITNMFETLIELKKERSDGLYELIRFDNVDEQLTLSRSKSYVKLIEDTQGYQTSINHLMAIKLYSEHLTLHSDLTAINKISTHGHALFTWHQSQRQKVYNESSELSRQLDVLEPLIMGEKGQLFLWQIQLDLYAEYHALLVKQQHQVNLYSEYENQPYVAQASSLPPQLIALFDKWQIQIKVNNVQLQQGLLITLAMTLFTLLLVLWLIHRRVKLFMRKSVDIISQKIVGGSPVQYQSIEQQEIVALLSSAVTSNDNEDDVLTLEVNHHKSVSFLAEHHNIAYWQLTEAFDNEDALNMFVDALEIKASISLRHCFSVDEFKKLLAAARQVKSTQQAVTVKVTGLNHRNLSFVIDYQEYWCGSITIVNNDAINVIETASMVHVDANHITEHDEVVLVDLPSEQTEYYGQFTQALNNKIIKAMLQSQAECLTRKKPSPTLYKQLTRLLAWGKASQDVAELSSDYYIEKTSKVTLQSQIYSALSQVYLNVRTQKSDVLFDDKLPAPYAVDIDTVVFSNLLKAVSRLMLGLHRNSSLLLSCKLIKRNDALSVIRYQFSLSSEALISEVPVSLQALQVGYHGDITQQSPVVSLIRLQLSKMNGQIVQLEKTVTGYCLAIEMSHYHVEHSTEFTGYPDFNNKHFVVLSDNEKQANIMNQYLVNVDAKVTIAATVEAAVALLNEQSLQSNAVDMVIIAEKGELFSPMIHDAIMPLNHSLMPKVFTLGNARLNDNAVYSQLPYPLSKEMLLKDIADLDKAPAKQNNQYYNNAELEQYRFVATGIEVLLAVDELAKYQVLVQQLTILGFNLTLAASEDELLSLWQTGRYLILISDFAQSPMIELDNGKQVKRGIFNLSQAHFDKWQPSFTDKKWQCSYITNQPTFDILLEQLSPWLVKNAKPFNLIKTEALNQEPAVELNEATANVSDNESVVEVFAPLVDDETNASIDNFPEAFSLLGFANNQASPELAMLMLDDYLAENTLYLEKLACAISEKSTEHCLEYIAPLIFNARALTAQDWLIALRELEILIEQQDFKAAQAALVNVNCLADNIQRFAETI